jgi:hypothetical protein
MITAVPPVRRSPFYGNRPEKDPEPPWLLYRHVRLSLIPTTPEAIADNPETIKKTNDTARLCGVDKASSTSNSRPDRAILDEQCTAA